MNIFKISIARAVFIFCLFKLFPTFSQPNTNEYQVVDSLIGQYEQKNSLKIYYQPEWFAGKKLQRSVVEFPVEEFLYKLTQTCKCSLVTIDSFTYVFVLPEVSVRKTNAGEENSVILIGKMQEYGKYKKALVSGKIIDGKTGDPLPGATLFVDKLNRRVTTDKFGNYIIEMPIGEYEVKITFMGFVESLRNINLVSNGNVNFELFEKSVNLSEVVITSERAEQNISRTQMSLVRLDAKAIKELPVSLGEIDILKSISLLPGIQSSGEFGTGFFVRGGSADQNLILIEDVPVFNSSHLFGLNSIINSDAISNFTLLKAGFPAKYGERSSSIMDIRLGASNLDKAKVKGGIGILNSKLNAELPIVKNKLNLFIGGRTSYSNWLLHQMPDIDLMNSSAGFSDLNALLTYMINPNNKLTFFGYSSNDKFGIKNTVYYRYGNTLGSIRWNHTFGHSLSSVLVAGLSNYSYNLSEMDTLHREEGYKINSSLQYKNLKYNFIWIVGNSHTFDFGFNAISYGVHAGDLKKYDTLSLINTVTQQKEQALEYALYASDNINITDKLSAEIGLRYSGYAFLGPGSEFVYNPTLPRSEETITKVNQYSKNEVIKSYSGFEPRVSMRFSLSNNNSFKISYNRINQYINLISNTMVMNPADIWKLSNNNVKPLVCDQFAAGYFHNFKNNTFETSIEFYYKKLDNIIEYKDGASILVNPYIDADLLNAKGFNYGIEMYIKKSSGRLTGWLSYSLSTSQRRTNGKVDEEIINNNTYYPSSFDKPHNFDIVGNYHISRRWRFSWTFAYNTGRPVTLPEYTYNVGNNQLIYYSDRNKYRIPDYHRLDIAITLDESLKIKKFWKGSWTFSIINLYGRKNPYSVFFHKEVPSEMNNNRPYSLYTLYIIGRPLPTITYNFSF